MHRIEQTAQHTAGAGGRTEELGYGMIDPVAALTAVLPDEHPVQPQSALPTPLDALRPPPADDAIPRTVAMIGSAAALSLLALTVLVTHILRRHDRIQRG
jgi:membrane-anchored mycosin MYCP